jgi:hypothetical protein
MPKLYTHRASPTFGPEHMISTALAHGDRKQGPMHRDVHQPSFLGVCVCVFVCVKPSRPFPPDISNQEVKSKNVTRCICLETNMKMICSGIVRCDRSQRGGKMTARPLAAEIYLSFPVSSRHPTYSPVLRC